MWQVSRPEGYNTFMFRTFNNIKNLHHSEDIYVLGSGPTLDHINPRFFIDKVVVATNGVADRLGLYDIAQEVYTHGHYHDEMLELARKYPFNQFVAPEGDRGFLGVPEDQSLRNLFYYKHVPTQYDFDVDRSWVDDGFIVGSTSTHGAMHLAAHMGAWNIILVGVDCGTIDGETNHTGYKSGNLDNPDPIPFLTRWNEHLIAVKRKLMEEYDVNVYSLNPWVNLNLEGHTFKGSRNVRLCSTCGMHCADLH